MRRDQTFHETLIPLLVSGIGAESYLEFGTHLNETIGRVLCPRKFGVDVAALDCEGAEMFKMTTEEFIEKEAPRLAPFDVVFIDADHSHQMVMADLRGIWPHVSSEGLVLLHDTNPETLADTAPGLCGDGWVAAVMVRGIEESVTLPYHPGLTIIRKRETWGPQR